MQGDEERFLALGADAYVSKPIAMQALKSILAGLIPVMSTEAVPKPLGTSPL